MTREERDEVERLQRLAAGLERCLAAIPLRVPMARDAALAARDDRRQLEVAAELAHVRYLELAATFRTEPATRDPLIDGATRECLAWLAAASAVLGMCLMSTCVGALRWL